MAQAQRQQQQQAPAQSPQQPRTWKNTHSTTSGSIVAERSTENIPPNEEIQREEDAPAHEHTQEAPNEEEENHSNSVLSVPMLPGVSLEPIYRQHRSLSFSMGQDPTFFGYDDYGDDDDDDARQYKNSLETMTEEDELADDDMDVARFRVRSKSSGAALSMLSSSQQGYLFDRYMRRDVEEEQGDLLGQRRRSSTDMWNGTAPSESQDGVAASAQSHEQRPPEHNPIKQLAEQLESMQLRQQQPPPYPTTTSYPIYPVPPPDVYHHPLHPHPVTTTGAPPAAGFQAAAPPPRPPFMHHPEGESSDYQEMGKGVALHRLDPEARLYMVEFKAGRTDYFYILPDSPVQPRVNDLVIVEADRGKDLGTVRMEGLSSDQVLELARQSPKSNNNTDDQQEITKADIHIKRIYRLAMPEEVNALELKAQEEQRALAVCQQKTRQRKLPMEVVDAEYQWDHRKLTFYFVADRRIDFRELVRELFKIYKTRIWMCAVNPSPS